jgi:ParB-like chromosome segregation protein Spo0J
MKLKSNLGLKLKIRINKRYQDLVLPLSSDDYSNLKNSIKNNGQYMPIVTNSDGVILDGYHRYKACLELSLEPIIIIKSFPDELQEELFIIDCNLTRRQLNSFQRAELALRSKPILIEIARRNKSLGGRGVEIKTPLGRVDQEIGRRAGLGKDTVRKVEVIIGKATPELLDKVRSGRGMITIHKAYKTILKEKKRTQIIKGTNPITTINNNDSRCKLINDDFRLGTELC